MGVRPADFAPIRLEELGAAAVGGCLEVVLASGERLVLREGESEPGSSSRATAAAS